LKAVNLYERVESFNGLQGPPGWTGVPAARGVRGGVGWPGKANTAISGAEPNTKGSSLCRAAEPR